MSSSTTFSSPSPTDGSGGTDGSTPRGASYFFGFLITFVGLLIIFIVCGIGSRRRFGRRRERGVNGAFEAGRLSNSKLEGAGAPQFYERPFVMGEDRWSSIMPLSASLFRENEIDSVAHDLQETPSAVPSSHPSTHITGRFFPLLKNDPPSQTQPDAEPPDTIQVAVMIIMPCRDMSPNGLENLPEYQIGEIGLPWGQDVPHPNP